jgi:hypothetical protein
MRIKYELVSFENKIPGINWKVKKIFDTYKVKYDASFALTELLPNFEDFYFTTEKEAKDFILMEKLSQ